MSGGEWCIGSAQSADLALYDPGIKDRHCLLRLVDDTWSLARKDGPVTDSEGHKVDAIATLQPGTPFALNGVWLSVVSANTEWPAEEEPEDQPQASTETPLPPMNAERDADIAAPTRSRSLLGPLVMLGALLLFLATLIWGINTPAQPPTPLPVPGRTALKDAAEVRQVLQDMLNERELQSRISLVEQPGKILLKGRFDEDDLLQSTERMLLRFEQQYRSPLQVLSDLPEATPCCRSALSRSVWRACPTC